MCFEVKMVEKMKAENISQSAVCFTNLKDGWDAHKLRRAMASADAGTRSVKDVEFEGGMRAAFFEYKDVERPKEEDLFHPDEARGKIPRSLQCT